MNEHVIGSIEYIDFYGGFHFVRKYFKFRNFAIEWYQYCLLTIYGEPTVI